MADCQSILLAYAWPRVKHHTANISTDCRWCWLSTDTPPIPHQYLTKDSPIHCRHATDAICWPTLNRQENDSQPRCWSILGRLSIDSRLTSQLRVNWVSADIAADILIDSRPRCCRYIKHSPQMTHDPWPVYLVCFCFPSEGLRGVVLPPLSFHKLCVHNVNDLISTLSLALN